MNVGVLAFQGDFQEHLDVLRSMKVDAREVRAKDDLSAVDALIIPGGESTVMAKFLWETGVGEEIRRRAALRPLSPTPFPRKREKGAPRFPSYKIGGGKSLFVFGTCAGAILLAKKVTGKHAPKSLGLIDITVERNAYGSQAESFETTLTIGKKKVPAAFIRAPKITRVGKGVEILARHKGLPVLVRQGNVLVSTFHTEVRGEARVHKIFLGM